AKDTLCIGGLLHRRQIFDWKHHALVLISYVKNLRNRRSLLLPLRGFTLAEVLITLGIIGVVAALTIPTLISNNNKRIVETRLAKFYSTINQAIELSEVENGDKTKWDLLSTNADDNIAWFNKYLEPYLKTTKVVAENGGSSIYFPDGSMSRFSINGWYFYPKANDYGKQTSKQVSYMFNFRPRCYVGQDEVCKYHLNKGLEPYKFEWDGTEESLKNHASFGCYSETSSSHNYCTALIQMHNWKIPDDYPLKF
ncbi:type II secretion system protein, partial [bacterium]|nr:type II secretion system protein [bacterium]